MSSAEGFEVGCYPLPYALCVSKWLIGITLARRQECHARPSKVTGCIGRHACTPMDAEISLIAPEIEPLCSQSKHPRPSTQKQHSIREYPLALPPW